MSYREREDRDRDRDYDDRGGYSRGRDRDFRDNDRDRDDYGGRGRYGGRYEGDRGRDRGDRGERRGSAPPDISKLHSLLVLNITFKTTPRELSPLFERYGEVADIYIPRNRRTNVSRGFAFVRYKQKEEAEAAIEKLDGKVVDGREIGVQFAKYSRGSGDEPPKGRRDRERVRSRSPSPQRAQSRSPERDSPRAKRPRSVSPEERGQDEREDSDKRLDDEPVGGDSRPDDVEADYENDRD
ncbi:hypothetical protein NDN08_008329 [Rhodosorus marinus]|uniref:RRM domain-containing protein n=1 Tax=Rhodosorus marinus TaxID=101924 RepID=A0AAV8V015_9RHOD|nr:hypothetical protein NDN08_008329 [Rhodosorus marinus]